ncbi:MAG: sigma-70 family RNA polymerase sigma factor [Ruminococcus sp.]|nr:sigma-70 family RNA polymerase sigma factor [Ruminococcus sp.]
MICFLTVIDDPDDRDFFGEIYGKYHKMMFDCALKILKNHHDAEDAVQQVLLNLWKYIHNVKKVSEQKLAGYLYATTRNHCRDMIEKNKNTVLSFEGNPELKLITETTPELIAVQKFDNALFEEAFNELTPRYRQIIMDKAVLHLDDRQAAEHIKIKVTYVRECLSRARATMHKLYLEKLKEAENTAVSGRK